MLSVDIIKVLREDYAEADKKLFLFFVCYPSLAQLFYLIPSVTCSIYAKLCSQLSVYCLKARERQNTCKELCLP